MLSRSNPPLKTIEDSKFVTEENMMPNTEPTAKSRPERLLVSGVREKRSDVDPDKYLSPSLARSCFKWLLFFFLCLKTRVFVPSFKVGFHPPFLSTAFVSLYVFVVFPLIYNGILFVFFIWFSLCYPIVVNNLSQC